jgi:hypothetical protein
MLRRSIIFALVLNLSSLIPLPLMACAMAAGLESPCQCEVTANCARSIASASGAHAEDPVISCRCVATGIPIPQARESAANPTPTLLASHFVFPLPPRQSLNRAGLPRSLAPSDVGPPGRQALLCTFLI